MTTANENTKIPVEKMDAVDVQQQGQIDRALTLAGGALFVSIVVAVLNFSVFALAMWEVNKTVETLTAILQR